MKFSPKSFLLLVLFFAFASCRYEAKQPEQPNIDQRIDVPEPKSRDSSKLDSPIDPSIPDSHSPNRAKKKSGSKLDTLRPIKA